MTLAARLVLGSTLVVALVMLIYGATSLRQRDAISSAAHARETATLAQTIQVVANSAIGNDRVANLDRILHRLLEDPELDVSVVVDSAGRVLAGGASSGACIAPILAAAREQGAIQSWGSCHGRVRVVILPLDAPAAWLFLARRTTTLDQDQALSRRTIVLTTLALALFASLAIVMVLRVGLTRPLSSILVGVRQLGGPAIPRPVAVPRSARELQELARAFNEMVERLEGKREQLVRETTERIELEQRLLRSEVFAAIGRLSGGLAHELGSPLGVIAMRAEAIEGDGAATPAIREHAKEVSAEVDRIARLVRDLLHVAHRHGVVFAPVDLREVARAVRAAVAPDAAAGEIALDLSIPESEVLVAGDALLLRHALNNVAVNAVQAVRGAGGRGRVAIALERVDHTARVTIEDDGPGIDPRHLPSVTQPFYTTKDVGEGSGLGLAITAGIVEEHGGALTLSPRAEGGLSVRIDIPLLDDEGGQA